MTGPKRLSDKQLAANRANAQRSTGPHTPAGIGREPSLLRKRNRPLSAAQLAEAQSALRTILATSVPGLAGGTRSMGDLLNAGI